MKAKRGDLAVLVTMTRDFYIGEGTREHTTVEVCEVANITRDGIAKRVRPARYTTPIELARYPHRHQLYVIPADEIDVPTALATAAANPWPSGHPGMPYSSLEDVRAMLRPLRIGVTS